MRLKRLPPAVPNSVSWDLVILCCRCGGTRKYGEAGPAGWSADLDGKPYAAYVCDKCSKVRIRVRPGNYEWVKADSVPGLDRMEIGPLETEAYPLENGKYAVELPDGKKVFVEGDEISK